MYNDTGSFGIFQWRITGALSFLRKAITAHSFSHRSFSNKAVNLFSSAFPFKIITTELQGKAPPISKEKKPLESSLSHVNIFTSHWHSQNILRGKQITSAIFCIRETNTDSLQGTNGCWKYTAVTRNTCDKRFEKQCGLLDGALDQQPRKLYPVSPASSHSGCSVCTCYLSNPCFSPFTRGTPGMCRDPALASACAMPARGGLFHYHHPSQLGYKSGRLLAVIKQNTPQMVENHSCEQFIDLLNSATIYRNWLLIY